MEFTKQEKNGVIMVSLTGRLDAGSSGDAEAEFRRLIVAKVKLLVDLTGLEYVSSAGLRVLLVVAKEIRRNDGKMCLSALTESVNEVFEISGFSSIFDIAETEDEALNILNG